MRVYEMVAWPPARTADDTDARDRLLRAGHALSRENGISALTVRAVAARAEANPGSFVYHFGTRDAFVEALIER
jgi:AcrR family transcriptional regulator